MKLTSTQIEQTLGQFEAEPIPEDHPMVPQLNEVFGEHTMSSIAMASLSWNRPGAVWQGCNRPRSLTSESGVTTLRAPWNFTSPRRRTL